jgi:hypothetical protein
MFFVLIDRYFISFMYFILIQCKIGVKETGHCQTIKSVLVTREPWIA